MISTAANLQGSLRYRTMVVHWLLPGVLLFMVQNIFLAINLFPLGSPGKPYAFSILPYRLAQYQIVKGMHKVYQTNPIA